MPDEERVISPRLLRVAVVAFVAACFGVVVLVVLVVAGGVKYGLPMAKRIDTASTLILDCQYYDPRIQKMRSNPNCFPSAFNATTGAIKDAAGTVDKSLKQLTPKIAVAADNSKAASAKTVEVLGSVNDAVGTANTLLADGDEAVKALKKPVESLDKLISDTNASIDTLLKSGDTAVVAAAESLKKLSDLEDELKKAVATGSDQVGYIVNEMLGIIDGKEVQDILSGAAKTSVHFGEIMESVDTATRYLRQKVALIKKILWAIIDAVKFTISPIKR